MLEVIVCSHAEALIAKEAGADRVELISALSEGGLTPSDGTIRRVLEIYPNAAVMLRNTSKSFNYSPDDYRTYRLDLERMCELGVKRVVFGSLNSQRMPAIEEITKLFEGIDIKMTFHRAIEECNNLPLAVDELAKISNISHILTSGKNSSAAQKAGSDTFTQNMQNIISLFRTRRIKPIIGSGINAENLREIIEMFKKAYFKNFDIHIGRAARLNDDVAEDIDGAKIKKILQIMNY